jgi:hypothetical protein
LLQHKRAREESWIRPPDEALEVQFEEAWNTLDPLSPEDLLILAEESQLWKKLCVPQSEPIESPAHAS